jgi:hypothetical protein
MRTDRLPLVSQSWCREKGRVIVVAHVAKRVMRKGRTPSAVGGKKATDATMWASKTLKLQLDTTVHSTVCRRISSTMKHFIVHGHAGRDRDPEFTYRAPLAHPPAGMGHVTAAPIP